jgi:hypothetical protein
LLRLLPCLLLDLFTGLLLRLQLGGLARLLLRLLPCLLLGLFTGLLLRLQLRRLAGLLLCLFTGLVARLVAGLRDYRRCERCERRDDCDCHSAVRHLNLLKISPERRRYLEGSISCPLS